MAVLFAFPRNEGLAKTLLETGCFDRGDFTLHHFPDGETLIRIDSNVSGRDVVVLCTLDRPDEKGMALAFFAETARELGAKSVKLMAPYLGYMRQDKKFHEGEALTSRIFAAFLSRHFDGLTTIDPHLHRYGKMDEIYTIPVVVVHVAEAMAVWIKENVETPLLIGPDEESAQWVAEIAGRAGVPCTVLTKTRHSDTNVEISIPDIGVYTTHTPVLVDDIISTARTMMATVRHLQAARLKPPVCMGIHAVFANTAWQDLRDCGVKEIVTCNTILHPTNRIDIASLLVNVPM